MKRDQDRRASVSEELSKASGVNKDLIMNLTDGQNNKIVEDLNNDQERVKNLIKQGMKEQADSNNQNCNPKQYDFTDIKFKTNIGVDLGTKRTNDHPA